MKTIVRFIACLSFTAALAACQQFEIDTQMTPEKEYASLRLVCDAVDAYSFAATGAESITFNVSANTPWTVTRSSGADWCNVTPSSSSASALIADVVVSVDDNMSGEDRTATLTIKGETELVASTDYRRLHAQDGNTIAILAGTYNFDPTSYVDADNYVVTDNGDATWTVSAAE